MPRDRIVRCLSYTSPEGELEGYLFYRVEFERQHHRPASELIVIELLALSTAAYVALWRFCFEADLISSVKANLRPIDEPLAWLLTNTRAAMQQTRRGDFLWLRPLDMPRFFGARRYLAEGRVVLEVDDPMGLCGGRFVLEGGPNGGTCRATDEAADLRMGVAALGAIALGGTSLRVLAEAGQIDEERAGALDRAERMFHWPAAPWCSTGF
jgi:predicted acetyltransferase